MHPSQKVEWLQMQFRPSAFWKRIPGRDSASRSEEHVEAQNAMRDGSYTGSYSMIDHANQSRMSWVRK